MRKLFLIILLSSLSLHAAENIQDEKLNEQDANGNTPLMIALKNDAPERALALIKVCGAQEKLLVDVNKTNNKKQMPLHCTVADGYDRVVKALLARPDVEGLLPGDVAKDFKTKLLLCSAMNKVEL